MAEKAGIWKEIGDAFDTKFEDRTEFQKQLTTNGLCRALFLILSDLNDFLGATDLYERINNDVINYEDRIGIYFHKIRSPMFGDEFLTTDPTELLEADAFRAKYCYERMNEEERNDGS